MPSRSALAAGIWKLAQLLIEPGHAHAGRYISSTAAPQVIRRKMEDIQLSQELEAQAEPKMDLLRKFMGPETMCQAELNRGRLQEASKQYQRFDGDTGSTEVQVARLTEKIAYMAQHMQTHRKDFHSRRGLQGMLHRRRKLLQYFRRTDFDAYSVLLLRLGLRDNYAKQDRFSARTFQ